jgi:hypothetical protein
MGFRCVLRFRKFDATTRLPPGVVVTVGTGPNHDAFRTEP